MIYYQNSWRILEENSCMLLTGDIIDWRYFAWRYIAGDIIYWRYYWLAIFCLAILFTGDIIDWRYFFRTPFIRNAYMYTVWSQFNIHYIILLV